MRLLTVCQPYASLIALGHKPIENRRWRTPYRGQVAIHAGKSRDWMSAAPAYQQHGIASYPFGVVLAVARLADCVTVSNLPHHLLGNEHADGPYCFVLVDVQPLRTPLPWVGARGLVPLGLADQRRIEAAL